MSKTFERVSLLLSIFVSLAATGQEMEEQRILKHFPIQASDIVEIENRYGDIELLTWEKDSIRFEIHVKVYSDKYDWRSEMMDNIIIDVDRSAGFVMAETSWSSEMNIWKKSVFGVKQGIGSTDRVEVDYTVHLPDGIVVEIRNSFGDVFIGNYNGSLDIEVDHGDLRGRNLTDVRSLEVHYGRMKISRMVKAKVELGSGASADIGEVEELMVEMSSSELDIEKVERLNIRSRNDEIHLEEVGQLDGSFSLSDLEVESLNGRMDADLRLGSLKVQTVEKTVSVMDVNSSRTDVIIGLAPGFSGRFEVEVDDQEQLVYPAELSLSSQTKEDSKTSLFTGQVGSNLESLVVIHAQDGNVRIGNR